MFGHDGTLSLLYQWWFKSAESSWPRLHFNNPSALFQPSVYSIHSNISKSSSFPYVASSGMVICPLLPPSDVQSELLYPLFLLFILDSNVLWPFCRALKGGGLRLLLGKWRVLVWGTPLLLRTGPCVVGLCHGIPQAKMNSMGSGQDVCTQRINWLYLVALLRKRGVDQPHQVS